jgi:hypothetical protein
VTHRPSHRPAGRLLRAARREAKTKTSSSGERSIVSATSEQPLAQKNTEEESAAALDMYELSRFIGVPVSIDETGWLRDTIELLFVRTADGIHPTEVKVGADISAMDLCELGNAFDLCGRYNRVVNQLRLTCSAEIMEKITARQEERMGYRRVKYSTLVREIEFLSECLKELTG